MAKKSPILHAIFRSFLVLGLAGAILLSGGLLVQANTGSEPVISNEVSASTSTAPSTENLVISAEVSAQAPDDGLPPPASFAISGEVGAGTQDQPIILGEFVISGEVSVTTSSVTPAPEVFAISGEVSTRTSDQPTPPRPPRRGGGGGGSLISPPVVPVAPLPPPVCQEYLHQYIRLGWPNNPHEVLKLQLFLHYFEGFEVPFTGVYDEVTFRAVELFQARYARDVLNPWGLANQEPTGFVFVTTRMAINHIYCGRSTAHDLDLRHIYKTEIKRLGLAPLPEFAPILPSGVIEPEEMPEVSVEPIAPEPVGSVVSEEPGTGLVVGAMLAWLDFMTARPALWLITIFILAVLILVYLIWKLREDDTEPLPIDVGIIDEGEEVIIEEDIGEDGELVSPEDLFTEPEAEPEPKSRRKK